MNPKRQFRQLRNDDRWIDLPRTSSGPLRAPAASGARARKTHFSTVVAFLIAGVIAVGLWAGLSGLHPAQPGSLSPLPSSTSKPLAPIGAPCPDSGRLAPIGCSTYTATAAAGIPGGPKAWTGAPAPTVTLRVLSGRVTALVGTGCNGLTVPVTLTSTGITPTGSVLSTSMLCTGASNAQDRWMGELFRGSVSYTLDGADLRLTAGSRSLNLTATATTPTTSALIEPLITPAPFSRRTFPAKPTSAGCPATSAQVPKNAVTSPIGDVDGDGRPDVEWTAFISSGAIDWGVHTASGAVVGVNTGFASGGERSVSIGTLASGQGIALVSDGHSVELFVLHDCSWTSPKNSAFGTGYGEPVTDRGAGCINGKLYAFSQTPTTDGKETTLAGEEVHIATSAKTVTRDRTHIFGRVLDATTPESTSKQYEGNTCTPSKRITPKPRT